MSPKTSCVRVCIITLVAMCEMKSAFELWQSAQSLTLPYSSPSCFEPIHIVSFPPLQILKMAQKPFEGGGAISDYP